MWVLCSLLRPHLIHRIIDSYAWGNNARRDPFSDAHRNIDSRSGIHTSWCPFQAGEQGLHFREFADVGH